MCAGAGRGRRCRQSKDTWIHHNRFFSRREKYCSPLKDVHHAVAEDTGYPVHLVGGIVGEDEAAGLVVADAALVLHLDVVRVDLRPGQHVERAVVGPSEEDASSAVMSVKRYSTLVSLTCILFKLSLMIQILD